MDMSFTVDGSFNYYKLVRCIEGEKKAGARVMRSVNARLERKFLNEGPMTLKKSEQKELQRLGGMIQNAGCRGDLNYGLFEGLK
jgi:hypothetical protein